MRISSIAFVLVLLGCGTKKNPEACCVDEADCASIGLPVGSNCDDGLLCRGHRCVEVNCDVSAQCDLSAPYCVGAPDGVCQESCADDMQCPGFGQSTDDKFCEAGACVACRAAMNDCGIATPVCDAGSCRRCQAHSECTSGVCTTDGSCALETEIAYVAPFGTAGTNCTRTEPCTLNRSLDPTIDRKYTLLAAGAYQHTSTTTISGRRNLIGNGSPPPRITNINTGAILRIAPGAEVDIDNLEISGAKNTTIADLDGNGIDCQDAAINATVRIVRSVLKNNYGGLRGAHCTFEVRESTVSGNMLGVHMTDSKGTVDRSFVTENAETGLHLDAGIYTATNNFIVRNANGVALYPSSSGTVFQFNTVADNSMTGVYCEVIGGVTYAFPNNLIARNATNLSVFFCAFDGSMTMPNVTTLKFKSPDVAPFDYHLTAGSVAIDQISASTQTKDFDGESRPFGAGHDYGADELH